MQPVPPEVLYANVRSFGEIYTDDFEFETSVRNTCSSGAAACQLSRICLLAERTAIWIPLCSRGCISNLDLLFTNSYRSGKTTDLSSFGVDFSKFVTVRIKSYAGKASIFIDGKKVFSVNSGIVRARIIGIDFRFQGTGAVDYVKLSNSRLKYQDDFGSPGH